MSNRKTPDEVLASMIAHVQRTPAGRDAYERTGFLGTVNRIARTYHPDALRRLDTAGRTRVQYERKGEVVPADRVDILDYARGVIVAYFYEVRP